MRSAVRGATDRLRLSSAAPTLIQQDHDASYDDLGVVTAGALVTLSAAALHPRCSRRVEAAGTDEDVVMLTRGRIERLSAVNERRLDYWEQAGFIESALDTPALGRSLVRLHGCHDSHGALRAS